MYNKYFLAYQQALLQTLCMYTTNVIIISAFKELNVNGVDRKQNSRLWQRNKSNYTGKQKCLEIRNGTTSQGNVA